jgi:hypothetical protein
MARIQQQPLLFLFVHQEQKVPVHHPQQRMEEHPENNQNYTFKTVQLDTPTNQPTNQPTTQTECDLHSQLDRQSGN